MKIIRESITTNVWTTKITKLGSHASNAHSTMHDFIVHHIDLELKTKGQDHTELFLRDVLNWFHTTLFAQEGNAFATYMMVYQQNPNHE